MTRIIQLTDCHLMAQPDAELKGVRTHVGFDEVLTSIRSRYPEIDRLVITGDLTNDEQLVTYRNARRQLEQWLPRLRVLPGNHDDRGLIRQVFGAGVIEDGRIGFSEIVGAWRLIGLDSQLAHQVRGQLGSAQLQWLEQELASDPVRPVCLFLHHPPVTVKSAWLDKIGLEDAGELLQLLHKYRSVRVVCSGHVHQETTVIDGSLTMLTTPSTALQFRPETETLELDASVPAFRLLDLSPSGQFRTRVERLWPG